MFKVVNGAVRNIQFPIYFISEDQEIIKSLWFNTKEERESAFVCVRAVLSLLNAEYLNVSKGIKELERGGKEK